MGKCVYLKPIFIILLISTGMICTRNGWSYAHKTDSETTPFLVGDNISLNEKSKNHQTNETNLNDPSILGENFHDTENKNVNQNDISDTNNSSYNKLISETVPYYVNDLNNDKNKDKQLINNTISFIDRPNISILDDKILNNIDIIYNGENKILLYNYYKSIHYSIFLNNFLYQFKYFPTHIKNIQELYNKVNKTILNIEKTCENKRKKLAQKIDRLQDVTYNYENKINANYYNELKPITTDFVHCMNENFKTVAPDISQISKDVDYVYKHEELGDPHSMHKKYAARYETVTEQFENKLNRAKKSAILKTNDYVNSIKKVIEIAKKHDELKNVIDTLNFIKSYIEHIYMKYKYYLIKCNGAQIQLIGIEMKYKKYDIYKTNNYSKDDVIAKIKDLADTYADFNVSYESIIDLENVYNNKIQAFNNILNFMPHILIGKIDACTNHVVPNDEYDFKIIKPISILNKLEDVFFQAFGFNFSSTYDNKTLEISNAEINLIISDIIKYMKDLKNLIKEMEQIYKKDNTRHHIENTIKQLIINVDLNQAQNGLTKAIEEAKKWKSSKMATKKILDDKYSTVLSLETKIKDLCKEFTDKLNNSQYMKEYKDILIKNHIILETSIRI
ncbi:reticulocyte binding protein, putative [Plasmodium chabaudi chabaudi]|uniref:Reticulocyte binding protein, putative n=1 Tax=Plasmodium chabaudi chabaudi TaxID=31271 RepID=A0A4V0JZL8_PLACU|nr:reticulocyte binding protein, putative [Plasmodium chabaudi chabaudi]VTZ66191.1 reticulocyte binding protein, putative [Plasmodium chabaudi chabaudi]|eukprot:XP_016652962.1 reticulocyte binding protein, putative [Plasmodium chabaudi chabaudi]